MKPSIGRIVTYRSITGNYDVPAMITATVDSLWPGGVERGDVPALSSPEHVHLHVLTPGAQVGYQEHNVPLWEAGVDGEQRASAHPWPRSWRWPGRV